jgi:RNA processing factor Prp31
LIPQGVLELLRGIRSQLEGLISGMGGADLHPMSLGLSHSLSRYKLKFSPDKVDTMIVQVRDTFRMSRLQDVVDRPTPPLKIIA